MQKKLVKLSCFLNKHFQEPSVFSDDCVSPTWCQIYPNKQLGYLLYYIIASDENREISEQSNVCHRFLQNQGALYAALHTSYYLRYMV